MSATGVKFNKKALILTTGGAAVVIYVLYNVLPSLGTKYHTHSHKTWKSGHHQPIPQNIIDSQENIKIEKKEVDVSLKNKQVTVFYREAQPVNGKDVNIPVILLHGAGDSSEKWQNIGTMNLIATMGHRVVAIDLPGSGNSKDRIDFKDEAFFLAPFLHSIQMERPVIIAASYGGNYAIPYLMEPDADSCHKRSRGFIPIAATSTGKYKAAQYHRCDVPSMLVFGVNDTRLGLNMVGDLRNLLNNEIEPIKKAGHAVMFERPKEWHMLLFNFLKTILDKENIQ